MLRALLNSLRRSAPAAASPAALTELGFDLQKGGDVRGALARYRQALAADPRFARAHLLAASALLHLDETDEALIRATQAVELMPNNADAWNVLGEAQRILDRPAEAVVSYQRALSIAGRRNDVLNNLGAANIALGDTRAAIRDYRDALSLAPDSRTTASNLLYALLLSEDATPTEILAAHTSWAMRHAPPPAAPGTKREPRRDAPWRIGYVSADFRRHAMLSFIEPLLAGHDRRRFEIYCYSNNPVADDATARLRGYDLEWRNIDGLADDDLLEEIATDEIDILIDLSGHTNGNRLTAFARRLAPVQATLLGYAATTGIEAMDYRFTDGVAEPAPGVERDGTERLVRLPDCLWCFRPPDEAPQAAPPPLAKNGFVTFGSFNNPAKIGDSVVAAWARVLLATPGSHLLVAPVREQGADRLRGAFAAHGVGAERLVFRPPQPRADFLRLAAEVDIVLDSFPCNGGATTCETLWMGVPVVALAGNAFRGRAGASLLTCIGLGELVASDIDHYVSLCTELAAAPARTAQLRATMRERMRGSPLMDEARYVRAVEAAFESMIADRTGRHARR
jgi:predicted O-linked N-acetylglucosamine transferase (SPINDLY family)